MTARTEQQFAIVAERFVLHVGGNGVGAGFLFGEGDVVVHAILLGIHGSLLLHQSLEQRTVFGRYGEVYGHLAVLIGGIERAFHQVFFQRRAAAVLVAVEFQQAFGQRTVVQSGGLQQGGDHSLVVSFGNQSGNLLSGGLQASRVQVVVESEFLNLLEEGLFKSGLGSVIVRTQKLEHILEHTACRTRSGHKLHHHLVRLRIGFPRIEVFLLLVRAGCQDTFLYGSGSGELQIGKSFFKTCQLFGDFLFRDAFLFKQLFVLLCHHNIWFLLIHAQNYKKSRTGIKKMKKKLTFEAENTDDYGN